MADAASSLDDDAPDGILRAPGRPIVGDDEVEAELQRLERSATFRQSSQLRRLLRHLVVHAQRGEESALREIAVGVAALGRDPRSFDPKADPIVRTEARRLRTKLAAYYNSEGRDDPLTIDLPKGGYVPVLHARVAPELIDAASVAILPFANFTGDPARESFCDALTDELIDALARIEGLRVVARTSAFKFKGTRDDVREIAKQLAVRTVLEGSVQLVDTKVRVLAQLILAADGTHLWSQAFVADTAGLPTLQETLADEIVRSLERAGVLPVSPRETPLRAPRGTHDPEARDRYDRALGVLRTLEIGRYDRARELLNEALARDPGFARAHHLLALELANRVSMATLPASEASGERGDARRTRAPRARAVDRSRVCAGPRAACVAQRRVGARLDKSTFRGSSRRTKRTWQFRSPQHLRQSPCADGSVRRGRSRARARYRPRPAAPDAAVQRRLCGVVCRPTRPGGRALRRDSRCRPAARGGRPPCRRAHCGKANRRRIETRTRARAGAARQADHGCAIGRGASRKRRSRGRTARARRRHADIDGSGLGADGAGVVPCRRRRP